MHPILLRALALGGLIFSTLPCPAQTKDSQRLELQIQSVVEKVRPATVAVRMNDGDASGVIVSAEGHVLTAGHCVMEPGTEFTIELPDGRQFDAIGLGMEPALDCGLIKITEEGDWPFVELGWSSTLKKNQPCISLGHSHGFNQQRGPVVRFGKIVEPISEVNGYIQSTCLMEPGDSGGPLFDLEGRLIGIHSQCGEILEENWEVPVDAFRQYWAQLNKQETFQSYKTTAGPDFGLELPQGSTSGGMHATSSRGVKVRKVNNGGWADQQGFKKSDRIVRIAGQKVVNPHQARLALFREYILKNRELEIEVNRGDEPTTLTVDISKAELTDNNQWCRYEKDLHAKPFDRVDDLKEQFTELEEKLDDHCVRVASELKGKIKLTQGTAVQFNEQTFVICKASLVGKSPKLLSPGSRVEADLYFVDKNNDLVILLPTAKTELCPVQIPKAIDDQDLGEFLISPSTKNNGELGVRGSPAFNNKSNGFLGVVFEQRDDQVILEQVVESSPAEEAGLAVGDQIVQIAEQKVDSPLAMIQAISSYAAGDKIQVTLLRDQETKDIAVTLGARDEEQFQMGGVHAADRFKGGKSKVRTGFNSVIPYDAPILARNCGGPVFDTDGNWIGINIARFSRTQSYILPKQQIVLALQKASEEKVK